MAHHNHKDEDADNLDGLESSAGLLGKEKEVEKEDDLPFCGWLSVRYYQPYFDVDTKDIFSRVYSSTIYCGQQDSFLSLVGDKPDLYGPFWVSFGLGFILFDFHYFFTASLSYCFTSSNDN